MTRPRGHIYFLQAHNRVKIGYTRDFKSRLRGLQTSCPEKLECVLLLPGSREDERRIHSRLSEHRAHGEWFFYSAPVRHFIKWMSESTVMPREAQLSLPFDNHDTHFLPAA